MCAASAADAVDATLDQGFGLAIVDIKMPEVDGLALMRMLKAGRRPVPVIAMSGYPTAETRASSLRGGASFFLPKPFTPEELVSALRAVVPAETDGVREE